MFKIIKPTIAVALVLLVNTAFGQQEKLRNDIIEIAKTSKGIVGVSVLGLEDRDTLNYNGNARLVMHSVLKLPVAMAILHLVDSGVMNLDKTIKVRKRDLPKTAVSPLRDKHPKGGDIPLSELLSDMISYSDNDACDILIDQLGGPAEVMKYLHSIKIKGINLETNEYDMDQSFPIQYTNWCKPVDIVKLLDAFYTGKVLSPASTDFLYKIMSETSTGPNRLKGLLPAGTVVAHKTGSSGTEEKTNLSPATNDVGIITLPNGKHFAIAVLITNSTADEATRELVIAKIAKAVYDRQWKNGISR